MISAAWRWPLRTPPFPTFSNQLIDPQTCSPPIRQTQIDGLPLKVYLCEQLAGGEYAVCSAGRRVRAAGRALSYYILTIKSDPRKELLLAIKNDQFYGLSTGGEVRRRCASAALRY